MAVDTTMDVSGYLAQHEDIRGSEGSPASQGSPSSSDSEEDFYFVPVQVTDGMVLPPTITSATSDDDDEEVQECTSGVRLRNYFYWEQDGCVYALVGSERLKHEGSGAIPGFACNLDGDFYKGHALSWGPLMEVQGWVGQL